MMRLQDLVHRWLRRPYRLHAAIDSGKGQHTIVLLHGLASNGLIWKDLAASLVARRQLRVLAYDLLGFGASAKPDWAQYTVEDHALSVMFSLKKSGARFPVTLVGHSMGCLVAVHLASKYPERIKRVILYEPPLFADIPEFSSHSRRRRLYFSVFERIADSPTMMLTYARLLGRAATKVAGFALSKETWLPFERSLRNTIIGQTAYQELHDITVPTDIVYGRFDIVVTQAEVKSMFASNKHIHFHRVADTHGVSKKSSRYLAALITGQKPRSRKSRVAYGRR
jgi:pimeloyl-ACP methyl ester carboxylesterase